MPWAPGRRPQFFFFFFAFLIFIFLVSLILFFDFLDILVIYEKKVFLTSLIPWIFPFL